MSDNPKTAIAEGKKWTYDVDPQKLITPPFRGSYVCFHVPHDYRDGKTPKFGCTLALPKKHPFWQEAKAACDAAATDKFGSVPKGLKYPFRPGNNTGKNPEHEGMVTMKVSSNDKPRNLMFADDGSGGKVECLDKADAYSGAHYIVVCRAGAWDHTTQGKGVSFYVDNTLKVRDDEPFGGRNAAEDDFANVVDEGFEEVEGGGVIPGVDGQDDEGGDNEGGGDNVEDLFA